MKILMIGQLPKGIGGSYTTGVANVIYELSKQKIDDEILYCYGTNIKNRRATDASKFHLQYSGYYYPIWGLIRSMIKNPVCTFRKWKHYMFIDHVNPLRFAIHELCIKNLLKIINPDIIHVHSPRMLSFVHYATSNPNQILLLTCHGIFYRGDDNKFLKDVFTGNLDFAHWFTALTETSKNEYQSILHIDKTRVFVVPNGVDCNKFYFCINSRNEIRKLFNVAESTKIIITVASVQKRKGQFDFVKWISKSKIDYQYWIIGGGVDCSVIESYCKENNLSDKVKLLGFIESSELYKYYSAADFYAHVSYLEGQALCEIEASATGLPTIVNHNIIDTMPYLDNRDMYILNYENEVDSLSEWMLAERPIRKSNITLDWSHILHQYSEIYNLINN